MSSLSAAAAASAAGIPAFFGYFVAALAMAVIFLTLYCLIAVRHEIQLIREGNTAAAISLGGALLGFAIPLAMSIAQSRDIADMAVWAGLAAVVQLAVFWTVGLIVGHEAKRIAEGDLSTASFLAFASVAAGLIDAACMTSGA
jgi:putative membrane protein